ncbi:DNA recombination protein RmuC [Aurantiacibacter xanthus]|uniref:DNA recombination protein RmuC homolog n=1 Tax=Aurantiacibacter xanthus TaxID=1784712 RepID=A0A3A1PC71_9SPHN|nr:DNA recombination protein RmuC [Aurantiacibacter xanthus]RIV91120.1 DNA recombination protein RmuC [Aurantiacibacter xanthus]
MPVEAIVAVVLALVLGVAVGWLVWGRDLARLRAELDAATVAGKELDEKFRRAIVDLEGAVVRAERADTLAGDLARVGAEREDFARQLSAVTSESGERARSIEGLREELHGARGKLEASEAARGKVERELAELRANVANFDEQKRLLVNAREEMLREFQNTGNAVLSKAQEKFIADAAARLGDAEAKNKEAVANLLKPVSERLEKYERTVGTLEQQRVNAFGELKGLLDRMHLSQEEVRREAQRLGNSLTNAPKARGRWGERALQNLLEQCGLAQHTDFLLEQSIDTDDGRLRPDAIVNVPGQKKLVIDSKVSLNAYQAAFEADDDEERRRQLKLHAQSMRGHVQTLGAKSYQSQFEDAPDYVVMFVPGEHFVAAALEADPELWDFAFEKKVLLATPTNLVAIARTVAQVWRQDALANEAREIGRIGTELYDRLSKASEHLKRMGGGLESAVKNYNNFVGSFERNVLTSARRMQEKGIEIGKREIEEVPFVEGVPRYVAADLAPEPEAAQIGADERREEVEQ